MSVWKSPVFYFGVILVLLIAFALMAPFTINWNAWKPEMEAYGRKLTGRDVSIAGPVEVRLFPWPRLEARDVRVSNEQGFDEAPVLAADSVTLRLSLAGLFSASLDVEEIALEAPQLNLVRNAKGDMNWNLKPEGEFDGLVSRVKLDRITVRQGSIWFEDKLHDQSASLTQIDANLAAEELAGPWRLLGKAVWRDVPVALNLNLGLVEKGKPLRLAAAAKPDDAELPGFNVDGEWDGTGFVGKARISAQESLTAQEPQEKQDAAGEKSSLEGALQPLALQADLAWTRDRISFDKIKIAPSDSRDSGTLIEGKAEIALTQPPKARLQLDSPRVNLDNILGAQSMARWRRGGLLGLASGVFAGFPEKFSTEFALDVNVLTLGGQSLNGVRLRGVAEKQAIRIHEATSNLPGRSRMRFDGIVFPASGGSAELGGTLAFESLDLRDFSNWALPGLKPDIAAHWKGARGRLKLQTNINWSPLRIAMQDQAFELDGQSGKAQGTWHFGEVPMVDGQVEMAQLDLDSYLSTKAKLAPHQLLFGALAALPTVLDIGQKAEQRVTLQLRSLILNGATASNVALDYEAGLSGFQLKALDVDALGGASIKGEGLVTNGQDGPLGEFDLSIAAQDVRASLQMAGLTSASNPAKWEGLLGPTQAKLNLAIQPDSGKPRVTYELVAQSGNVALKASGETHKNGSTDEPEIDSKIEASIPELSQLLQLYGMSATGQVGPASLDTELRGTRSKGMEAKLVFKAANAEASYNGKLVPEASYFGVSGSFNAKSPSLKKWIVLAGAPLQTKGDGAVEWHGKLSTDAGTLMVTHGSGTALGESFEINASADADQRWTVDAAVGAMELKQVLAAVLMPWQGDASDRSDSYAGFAGETLAWQAYLRPHLLETGLGPALAEAVIAIEVNDKSRGINIKTPGKSLSFDMLMKPKGSSFAITGQGEMTVAIGQVLKSEAGMPLAIGTARIAGAFNATGQSPAAALLAAEGKGSYWVEDFALASITAQGFAAGIEGAKRQVALAKVFEALTSPPGTPIGARTGGVEMSGGEAKLSPFGVTVDATALVLTPRVDLNVPDVNLEISAATTKRSDLPPVVVTYAGVPGQMDTRVANAAMAAKLGYELLALELAALEKLQQQEAEAIRKQEQQRKDDEERFAAFQAQRSELRSQLRLLRFRQQERKRVREEGEKDLAAAITLGDKLNKNELNRATRMRGIRRALAEPFTQP